MAKRKASPTVLEVIDEGYEHSSDSTTEAHEDEAEEYDGDENEDEGEGDDEGDDDEGDEGEGEDDDESGGQVRSELELCEGVEQVGATWEMRGMCRNFTHEGTTLDHVYVFGCLQRVKRDAWVEGIRYRLYTYTHTHTHPHSHTQTYAHTRTHTHRSGDWMQVKTGPSRSRSLATRMCVGHLRVDFAPGSKDRSILVKTNPSALFQVFFCSLF